MSTIPTGTLIIEQLMQEHPDLGRAGWPYRRAFGRTPRRGVIGEAEFTRCLSYLINAAFSREGARDFESTYGLKHDVEAWHAEIGYQPYYVPNGAMIAALMYLGAPLRKAPNSPNPAVSLRKLKKWREGFATTSLLEGERTLALPDPEGPQPGYAVSFDADGLLIQTLTWQPAAYVCPQGHSHDAVVVAAGEMGCDCDCCIAACAYADDDWNPFGVIGGSREARR